MTLRLYYLVRSKWALFDGELASRDIDPLYMPFDRFLNLIYWWAVQDADPKEIDKFDRQLWRPPKGEAPAAGSPWSPEAETAAFASLAATFGTGMRNGSRDGSTQSQGGGTS